MKKGYKNYRSDYSAAISAMSCNDEIFDNINDVKTELERQLARENESAAQFPEFYRLGEIMSGSKGRAYRTLSENGESYMTAEDYMRFIQNETMIPQYGNRPGIKVSRTEDARPATVYTVRGFGSSLSASERDDASSECVITANGPILARVENCASTFSGAVTEFFNRWFPSHVTVKPDRRLRRRMASSAAGIAWVMIFAVVIALPITIGVLKSEASAELADKKDKLAALEKQEEMLEAEFESSLDLRLIEDLAVNEFGMIKLNESTVRILKLNDIDSIESFDASRSTSPVPALLSALGIRIGEE